MPAISSGAPAAASSNSVLVVDSANSWTTWSYSPYNVNFANTGVSAADGLVYLPLAIDSWPSLTTYIPQLATSWSTHGNTFTLNLQPNAKWQDGTPVTSTDVVDTVLLGGADGYAIWNDITNVSAAGTHVVDFTLKSGEPLTTFESDLFTQVFPEPASVWGRFVSSSLKSEDQSYWSLVATNPSAATKSPAYKALSSLLSSLESYNPKTIVGDGPYELTSATIQELEFTKWSGFYDASKITIPRIIWEGTSQSELNAELLAGRVDFSASWLYMPPAILQEWLHTPGANLLAVPGSFQGVLIFKDNEYPFDITKVRQALAYAMPVQKADVFSWGNQDAHAVAPVPPDGLVARIAGNFLTQKQLNSLDPYSYDTSKAAKLLESAGFHRNSSGDWIMPNGKPFKLTLSIDSSWTDQVAAFQVLASALTSFGIPSVESTVENATYLNDMHTGGFQISAYCCTGASPNPLDDFVESPMGSAENYTSNGSYKGDNGISYGPVETVPGIGKVNVPDTLNKEYAATTPGPKMNALVYDWAKYVEDQVPFLEYAVFADQIAYSNRSFVWPSTSNQVWVDAGNNPMYDLLLGQERGLIRPK